eukprot:1055817-Prorocentrum_minimum.AAC.1
MPGQPGQGAEVRDCLVRDVAAAILEVGVRLTRTYAGALKVKLREFEDERQQEQEQEGEEGAGGPERDEPQAPPQRLCDSE